MLQSALFRPSNAKRIIFFVGIDLLVSYFTLILSYDLRFSFQVPLEFNLSVAFVFCTLIFLKILLLSIFKIYLVPWRFFGLLEALKIFYAHILAYGIFCILFFLNFFGNFPLSVIGIDFVISSIFIGAIRISKRIYVENSPKNSPKPAIIFGANTQSATLIKAALNSEIPFYPLAIIEEDEKTIGSYISNLKIYPKSALKELTQKHKIKSVILTHTFAKPPLEGIFNELTQLGIEEIKIASLLKDEKSIKQPLKSISIEDLLSRPSKDLDKEVIGAFLKDKRILITGAGGSIGSEIVRQCVEFGAKRIVLVEHSEFNLYAILEELNQNYPQRAENPNALFRPCLLSILEKDRLSALICEEKPDIIVHAAAYKHVPLCEYNQKSAIENNIIGSKNVLDSAIEANVPKVVVISTDKAVRPTNVMGATKRIVELYAQNVKSKKSEIVAVRFGNVLGSSGSVVPKFKAQIECGGPITVTHPEITRYFMLIPEACRLVLQAGAIARGGEIFILDMGEPVKIVDLAKNMLRLYGKENEISIEFSGLRPGEKLYEELLLDESEEKTKYPSIQVARPTQYDIAKLNADIVELLACEDSTKRIAKLKEIVVEFHHNDNA